jgi:hypothetical protein
VNNTLHREGEKPAIIFSNGKKEWYKRGMFVYMQCL